MKNLKESLELFFQETKSESALIVSIGGTLRYSHNMMYGESVAAMSDAIINMCDKFLEDIEEGILNQAILKTNTHIIVFTKINETTFLVLFSKTGTNLGLFLHNVEELALNLKEKLLITD